MVDVCTYNSQQRQLNYQEITLNSKKPELLFMQLTSELQRLIEDSLFDSSITLLSIRKLSQILKINRSTVARAYAELLRNDFIEHKSKLQYRVSDKLRTTGVLPYPCIGLVLPYRFSEMVEINNGIMLEYLKGVIDTASAKKLSTMMLDLPPVGTTNRDVNMYNSNLLKKVIGVVHFGCRGNVRQIDNPLAALMKNNRLPQIIVSAYPKLNNIGAVVDENTRSTEQLLNQLRYFGHQRLGILLESDWQGSIGTSCFTYAGFFRDQKMRQIFTDHGFECSADDCAFHCNSLLSVKKMLARKFKAGNLPTFLWCHNDQIAYWCIQALEELGLHVPEDISVAGFDGIARLSETHELTTIGLPFYAIGQQAVKTLLDYHRNGISDNNRIIKIQSYFIPGKTISYAKTITKGGAK